MLTDKEKRILKDGTFEQQMGLLMDHFHDVDDKWIGKAREFFRNTHEEIFKQ